MSLPLLLHCGHRPHKLRWVAIYTVAKMADRPAQVYGQGIGSNYQSQGLALAKQFKQG